MRKQIKSGIVFIQEASKMLYESFYPLSTWLFLINNFVISFSIYWINKICHLNTKLRHIGFQIQHNMSFWSYFELSINTLQYFNNRSEIQLKLMLTINLFDLCLNKYTSQLIIFSYFYLNPYKHKTNLISKSIQSVLILFSTHGSAIYLIDAIFMNICLNLHI